MRGKFSFTARLGLTVALLGAGWCVFAFLAVPEVIRAVHAGRLGILATLMEGRASVPVEPYLAGWAKVARSITFLFATTLMTLGALRWLFSRAPDNDAARPGGELSIRDSLLVAVWFGLMTGSVQAYYMGAKVLFLHELVPDYRPAGPNALWMAPLSDATLFTAVGLLLSPVLLLVKRRSRKPGAADRLLTGSLSLLAFLTVLMLPGRIQLWSATLLAIGLAVGASRAGALERYLRRPFPARRILPLAAVPLALWLAVGAAERLRERRALSRPHPAAVAGAPNVLLLVLDTQRAQSMSLYGYYRPTTPRLGQLATEAVVFDRAIASSPWTLPSHGTMFTGRYDAELGTVSAEYLDDRFLALAETLRDHGYLTGGFVGNIVYGNDFYGLGQGFSRYRDESTSLGGILESAWLGRYIVGWIRKTVGDHHNLSRKQGDVVNREFLEWLDRTRGNRPFFAFLNYFDAHEPYQPPPPFDRKFAAEGARYWLKGGASGEYSPEAIQQLRDSYDGATAYVDANVGSLIDALRQRGVLDRTLLIIVSDHGEAFGEHGLMAHRQSLYLEELWVPLLIRYPARVPGGLRVRAPVSPRDIPATVLDLVGIRPAPPFPGATLARHWEGGPSGPTADTLLAEYGAVKALVVGRYHFLRLGDGRIELFDMESDPSETRDVADVLKEEVRVLRGTLERMMSALYRTREGGLRPGAGAPQ